MPALAKKGQKLQFEKEFNWKKFVMIGQENMEK